MNYSIEPCNSAKLSDFVSHFFYITTSSVFKETRRMIPTGRQYLLFFLSGEVEFTFRKGKQICNNIVTIGGLSNYCISYKAQPDTIILGVSLVANGLYKLLGCNLREIAERKVDSREVLKTNELQDVLNKLLSIENRKKQYEQIEDYLISKIPHVLEKSFVDNCIQLIGDLKGAIQSKELAHRMHVSKRHLEIEFARQVGLTPGKYANLIRFKYAFEEFSSGEVKPNELILKYNYIDYSHFLRDFKQYTGQTPKNIHLDNTALYRAYQREIKNRGIEN